MLRAGGTEREREWKMYYVRKNFMAHGVCARDCDEIQYKFITIEWKSKNRVRFHHHPNIHTETLIFEKLTSGIILHIIEYFPSDSWISTKYRLIYLNCATIKVWHEVFLKKLCERLFVLMFLLFYDGKVPAAKRHDHTFRYAWHESDYSILFLSFSQIHCMEWGSASK